MSVAGFSFSRSIFASAAILSVPFFLSGCELIRIEQELSPNASKIRIGESYVPVSQDKPQPFRGARPAPGQDWWELDQNWNSDFRTAFWFSPQGSRMIPYDWFVALETEKDQTRFVGAESMARFNYVWARPDPTWNPQGLPVGFAKSPADKDGLTWAGPTCSACHSNLMLLDGKPVMVDGAPSLADFQGMNQALVNAMLATDADDAKFERFAQAVLASKYTPDAAKKLRGNLQLQTQVLAMRNEQNMPDHGIPAYGFGRVDAVGAIFNRVASTDIKAPANNIPADAPVSYPFLWGAPQSDVVQWNGLAPNGKEGLGPLVRNVGEVMGVYGRVDVKNKTGEEFLTATKDWDQINQNLDFIGYKSSVVFHNLGLLEKWLGDLRSPPWPEDLLKPVDRQLASAGEEIYKREGSCASCHTAVSRAEQGNPYNATMIQASIVGTDPKMVDNFLLALNPRTLKAWESGLLQGTRPAIIPLLGGKPYGETLPGRANALVTTVVGAILGKPGPAVGAAFESYIKEKKAASFDPRSYKARPLTGIWATAPYLHNGSVPSLAELLKPAEERVKTFHVGNRNFDPETVGFLTTAAKYSFEFNTALPGNSNAGHSGKDYGTTLSATEKRQLLEYLKTL